MRNPPCGPRNRQRWNILGITIGGSSSIAAPQATVTGAGAQQVKVETTDNTTSSSAQLSAFANSSLASLLSHAAARVAVRYGITLGGWVELLATDNSGTNNGLIVGVQGAKPIVFGTNNVERIRITSDGRFYGTALHNNAGSITGTTTQYIASGSGAGSYYVPTLTNTANITSSTIGYATFIRAGNVVDVQVRGTVRPAAVGACQIDISLPVASNLTAAGELNGIGTYVHTVVPGFPGTVGLNAGWVETDLTNDRASFIFQAPADPGVEERFDVRFQYEVL